MDVHPPLGKMLFSLVAYLLSFDGKFEFVLGTYVKPRPAKLMDEKIAI